jgi:hypothetical protein
MEGKRIADECACTFEGGILKNGESWRNRGGREDTGNFLNQAKR